MQPVGRAAELREIDVLLEAAAAGSGGVLNFFGPAGSGKTMLIGAAAQRARGRGFEVLGAAAVRGQPGRLLWAQLLTDAGADEVAARGLLHHAGDDAVLAEVLDARLYALWDPAGAGDRLETASALIQLGRAAGDGVRERAGLFWRFVALMELARVGEAEVALGAFERAADAAGDAEALAMALSRHAMLAMLRGRFDVGSELMAEFPPGRAGSACLMPSAWSQPSLQLRRSSVAVSANGKPGASRSARPPADSPAICTKQPRHGYSSRSAGGPRPPPNWNACCRRLWPLRALAGWER